MKKYVQYDNEKGFILTEEKIPEIGPSGAREWLASLGFVPSEWDGEGEEEQYEHSGSSETWFAEGGETPTNTFWYAIVVVNSFSRWHPVFCRTEADWLSLRVKLAPLALMSLAKKRLVKDES